MSLTPAEISDVRNVVIVGSGCSGLTAAIYAGRANLRPLVLEGHEPGGQLSITSDVENFPGFPAGIMGPELIENMRQQAARFGTTVHLIHRSDTFRASKIMLDRARAHEKIRFVTNTVVDEVLDISKDEVTGLRLRNIKTGELSELPVSALFLGIGHDPNAKWLHGQLDTDHDGYLVTRDYVFTKVEAQRALKTCKAFRKEARISFGLPVRS